VLNSESGGGYEGNYKQSLETSLEINGRVRNEKELSSPEGGGWGEGGPKNPKGDKDPVSCMKARSTGPHSNLEE